ncbi:hypothetical protein AB1Y20_019381 [Prymnesium parvum]|uniref:Uncharacterized protein n=1 Tax=Prymnesium parvum TaxID=97485 RepID=A0AB34JU86_PRYPA
MLQDVVQDSACRCLPVERSGHHYSELLSSLLHDCVYTPLDQVAVVLGFLNIVFWAVSQCPQLYKNYLRGNCQGLSLLFLLGWAVADTASLLGCLLTQQQAYMTFTSAYFCVADAVLLSQFSYYSWRVHAASSEEHEKRLQLHTHLISPAARRPEAIFESITTPPFHHLPTESSSCHDLTAVTHQVHKRSRRRLLHTVVALACSVMMLFIVVASAAAGVVHSQSHLETASPLCDERASMPPWAAALGTVFAWTSNTIFIGARLPQIVQNWRRQSVEGLSMMMFFLAAGGNICYSMSIIMRAPSILESRQISFWINTLPYLLSCILTMGCDLFILIQARWYSQQLFGKHSTIIEYA